MKRIKSLLKKIDVFGVPFSFRYKQDDKYQTSLGGLINSWALQYGLGFTTSFLLLTEKTILQSIIQ